MNGGKVEECNVCFFLLRLSQPLDKNEQQVLFSNSDYIDHDDHRGDDDDYIHDGGLGHDEETYEGSYGFAQSESCVKQTSETDGRQKQVLAGARLGGEARHMFLSPHPPSIIFYPPILAKQTV